MPVDGEPVFQERCARPTKVIRMTVEYHPEITYTGVKVTMGDGGPVIGYVIGLVNVESDGKHCQVDLQLLDTIGIVGRFLEGSTWMRLAFERKVEDAND